MMTTLSLYWVDAFTQEVFAGNPAAVVPLESWLPDGRMQRIAFENGLSETAFFVRTAQSRFQLRWFTPVAEIDLCGHATLASAHALFHCLEQVGEQLIFDSRSGPLTVSRRGDRYELDFPARVAIPAMEVPQALRAGLNIAPREFHVIPSQNRYLAMFESQAEVLALRPDFDLLTSLGDCRLIATAIGEDCDFVSRFFAPGIGVREDPVTGSAHCTLVPFWAARLDKHELHARQVSARGGELWCELHGDRVRMAGHCALYLRGEITV